MEITRKIFTYDSFKEKLPEFENDNFGIAKYFTEERRKTFLNNPNLNNFEDCAYVISEVDGVIGGRAMHFPTKLLLEESEVYSLSGSALEVVENYRHLAIGADLMSYPVFSDRHEFVIASGISEQALPMYKKLGYYIFNFDRLVRILNVKPILLAKGFNSKIASIVAPILNFLFKGFYYITQTKNNGYLIQEVTNIPESIAEISVPKGYKYMEIHDAQWLQWCLDYNFTSERRNRKGFYLISKDGKDIGFFMLKETFRKNAGGLKDILLGSIIEWGSLDSKNLSESDIYNIAIPFFSKSVDLIEIATSDETTERKMKRKGFLNFRKAHIVFKDKKKKYPDAKDVTNWRIRLGYADVPFT